MHIRDSTLSGNIASAGAKQDVIADILKVEGVKEVVSELTIGKAESDQKLAERIADQMRRSSYFTVFDDVEIGVDDGAVLGNRQRRRSITVAVLLRGLSDESVTRPSDLRRQREQRRIRPANDAFECG